MDRIFSSAAIEKLETQFIRRRYLWIPVVLISALLVALWSTAEAGQARLRDAMAASAASQWRQTALQQLLTLVLEAESSQRGFLLMQDRRYLERFDPAITRIEAVLDQLEQSYDRVPLQGIPAATDDLRRLSAARQAVMSATLRLYGEGSLELALRIVRTDYGKKVMDELRQSVSSLMRAESRDAAVREREWRRDLMFNRTVLALASLINIFLVILAGTLLARRMRARARLAAALEDTNKRLDQQVAERTADLAELSSYLQRITEEEKASLARELHDELGGLLISAKMDVVALRRSVNKEEAGLKERWERILKALDVGVDFKRRVIENLRPTLLDNLGLLAALRWLMEDNCNRASLECKLDLPEDMPEVSAEAGIALFRIAQESLMNVLKHAGASQVRVLLRSKDGRLQLRIVDDGAGIPLERIDLPQSHGLKGMRHRVAALGGTLVIERNEMGRGTVVEVSVPLDSILAASGGERRT